MQVLLAPLAAIVWWAASANSPRVNGACRYRFLCCQLVNAAEAVRRSCARRLGKLSVVA